MAEAVPAGPSDTLWERLGAIPDRRGRKGRQYGLASVMVLALAAMLAGADDLRAIFRWGRRLSPEALFLLGLERAPCHAMYIQDVGVDVRSRATPRPAPQMPPVRKPMVIDNSILNEMLAIRLQQLEIENGGMEAFLRKTRLARGTYYQVLRGIGNPTKTLDRIASSLNLSVLELLGFDIDDARGPEEERCQLRRSRLGALVKRNEADRRVARQTRSRKLPG